MNWILLFCLFASSPARAAEVGDAFKLDLSEFKKTDPKLVMCRESGRILVPLKELRGLATGPGDRIYVAGDKSLLVIDKDGATLRKTALDSPATCLSVDTNNTVYLGMTDHVEVYDEAGRRIGSWKPPARNTIITSIALSGENVFVADAGKRIVVRYDRAGQLLGRIGEKDVKRGIQGFVVPSPYFDVAIGRDGALWVVDPGRHFICNFTNDGALVSKWGTTSVSITGFCGCCNPTHIAIRADGSFVTSEKGIVRIKIYGPKGDFAGVVAGAEEFDEKTEGIDLAVDSRDRILALDPVSRCIRVYVEKK